MGPRQALVIRNALLPKERKGRSAPRRWSVVHAAKDGVDGWAFRVFAANAGDGGRSAAYGRPSPGPGRRLIGGHVCPIPNV